MKKLLLIVAVLFAAVNCYDDSALWESVNDHENRISELERMCREMNTNISSLKTIVEALQDNDYVTSVAPITEGGKEVGYTISFSKSGTVTIYHGKDGADGHTPVIGVCQDTDGVYYWTLDGTWLLDASGNKIPTTGQDGADGSDGTPGADGVNGSDGKDGVTPQLKIEDGYWYVSYDNGASWAVVGQATGDQGPQGEQGLQGNPGVNGDPMFADIDCSTINEYVTFILSNGTQIQIPTWYAFETLKAQCERMNNNIEILHALVLVHETRDFVKDVIPVVENGKEVGYIIKFGQRGSVTIYHGQDGQNGVDGKDGAPGKDGADGHTPVIGVCQDTDGVYYWTLDGTWLLDASGNKIPTTGQDGADGTPGADGVNGSDGQDGIIPQLKIEDGYWYVSYDNGTSWVVVGQATGGQGPQGEQGPQGDQGPQGNPGVNGDSFFQSVTQDNEFVCFTLADGTVITLPKRVSLAIEFDSDDLVVMSPNSSRDIRYTVTSILPEVEVEVMSSADIKAKVMADDAYTGVICVKTGDAIDEYSKVVVLVSNGEKVIMKTLTFEEEAIEVVDEAKVTANAEGGEIELLFFSNVECEVVIPEDVQSWISVAPTTRTMEKHTINLKVEPNESAARSAEVVVKSVDGNMSLTYTIAQEPNLNYQLALEREALIAIYNALDGDNWTDNKNWCSDEPVSKWDGVSTDKNGFVYYLRLDDARGQIPEELFMLTNLTFLSISNSRISNSRIYSTIPTSINKLSNLESLYLYGSFKGNIPKEIGDCLKLKKLQINRTSINGVIPSELGNLVNLERLELTNNSLSGELPESMGNMTQLINVNLSNNQLTGSIPNSIQELPMWKYNWGSVVMGNSFNTKTMTIPAPEIVGTGIDGETVNFPDQDSTSVLIQWSTVYHQLNNPYFVPHITQLNQIFSKYKDKVSFMGLARALNISSLEEYIQEHNILWPNIYWNFYNGSEVIVGWPVAVHSTSQRYYAANCEPAIFVFNNGEVTYWDLDIYDDFSGLDDYLAMNVLGETPDYYISTDYSHDGEIITKQTASVGNGIDLVVMGDAFSDRQIQDGTYYRSLDAIVNTFFSVEPFSSFKEYFNVYYVNVVSAVEGYEHDGQSLNTYFGSGTFVGGDSGKCIEYAMGAISEQRMDDALIIVAMNKDTYAGTCHMSLPTSGDYGRGLSIAYFPISSNLETFNGMVLHEANGHGFAKLADEYAYEDMGTVPSDYVSEIQSQQNSWGWWKNVDFTSNPLETRWSRFVNDIRYANEDLGAYEGGLHYWSGVWRPTENSIMRHNTGGFNAPSREAIYYRIHKLAYGDSWEYDYEKFVEWDARNRNNSAATRSMVYRPANYKPTHPPVVVNKSRKDAK